MINVKYRMEALLSGYLYKRDIKRFLREYDFKKDIRDQHINLTSPAFKNGIKLRLKSSDWNVFEQVFKNKEYEAVVRCMQANKIRPDLIVDLGANVGLTTLYFQMYFPRASYICVEPDTNNFKILSNNISANMKAQLLHAAIWHKEGAYLEPDEGLRDRTDWGRTFKESEADVDIYKIKGITINQLINTSDFDTIALLKIDIEGAERFIFNEVESNLSFLEKTKVIAIEIHDEFKIRDSIYHILSKYNFILYETGETTIGVNVNYIS